MRFGLFIAPFHRMGDNPTLCYENDLETVEWAEKVGYDEVFVGEHHSGGWEIIPSPEVFIANAAARGAADQARHRRGQYPLPSSA